ncbi:MAG TPA: hypothetical protein VFQ84_12465 [Arenimonas sp.]|uniref:hypothetical protein n=1 Tax=Arenimonas sp. TaxID=1872635 RepID=UPI002D7EE0C0|nr:hypothetical protein [Arenimonas sp.]HEU0154146.1 hypothetical protein [Arenimonas sp.]
MKRFLPLLVISIAGCATRPAQPPESALATSICLVSESKDEFIGKRIKVAALLNTDHMHYAFLKDPACGSGSILELGRMDGVPEYERLESGWLEECAQRGSQGLCVVSKPVVVVGSVRRGDEGCLVLDIIHISNEMFSRSN